jgi:membrane fusion protein (multidrug efflux system)
MDTRADPDAEAGERSTISLRRRKLLLLVAAGVIIAAILYGLYWIFVASKHVTTENAYVNADTVAITPLAAGNVVAVKVSTTQIVQPGDVLVELDPADAKIELEAAEANLAKVTRNIQQAFANTDALAAELRAKESALERAQQDLTRRKGLSLGKVVAVENYRHTVQDAVTAQAELDVAKAQLAAGQAMTSGFTIETHPDVIRARTQVEQAKLTLSRMTLRAPVGGVVSQRNVQVGRHVDAGIPLMVIVPLASAYIDANFKESQLRKVRVGQCAKLTSDFYGSGVVFHGRVAGLSGGTGAVFSLIPAQNATGNWIKVVQRLPVRITLDPAELKAHPLRVGLSMSADIKLADCPGH